MQSKAKIPGQTLIMVVGPPGSGKSTIAEILSNQLNAKHFDIDDVRLWAFGKPIPNDGIDPAIKAIDDRQMAGTYNVVFGLIDGFLRAETPLIFTCTLSSKKWGQDRLESIYRKYPNARIGIIWCWPEITSEQMSDRFVVRAASGNYVGATTDPNRAWELRGLYQPIELPHLKLDTGPKFTPRVSSVIALCYILSQQTYDASVATTD